MSVTVTLHVFSGVPDPTWELTDQQALELGDRIGKITNSTLLKPPGIVGALGYRGFSVNSVKERILDPLVYIHAGIVDQDRFDQNRMDRHTDLEQWLLSTGGDLVHPDVKSYVNSALIELGNSISEVPVNSAATRTVPLYNPGKWNNDPRIRTLNNCYNYANDKITNSFAQPGRGSGRVFTVIACSDVGSAAQRDGQMPVGCASSSPLQGHFVALAIWPHQDYHWYRLDNNTWWSHKPGEAPVRNTDNSEQHITDPAKCNRGPYLEFCGYYLCVPANSHIR